VEEPADRFEERPVRLDGCLIGADGVPRDRYTPFREVEPVRPRDGGKMRAIFINGVLNTPETQLETMRRIAKHTGYKVTGIHNQVPASGLLKAFVDRAQPQDLPAARTLALVIEGELLDGHHVHLLAHSHGGVVTSHALEKVERHLRHQHGLSKKRARHLLKKVRVETFGSAQKRFEVKGPKYVHYVNEEDLVGAYLGLGKLRRGSAFPGDGAVVMRFSEKPRYHSSEWMKAHAMKFYLPFRTSFTQARHPDR
jgi:hypothetical protein